MSEKKMVSRNTLLALGIICIILVAGLGGALAYYITDKNNTISVLNSQVSDKDNQISGLNDNVTILQNQVKDLTDIIGINKSEVVYNTSNIVTYPPFNGLDLPATWSYRTVVGDYVLDNNCGRYAGYVVVQVSSTSNDTYVQRTIIFNDIIFDNQIDVGMNGTALFPVLPAKGGGNLLITVSTHNATIKVRATNVIITYYY
jgi:hypothetical protein